MSDHQNALQKPVFAPVSQGNKLVDDIDLSDIFAEYFNDGGEDPLTTFSSPSICGDAAAAGQRIQQQQVQQISSIVGPDLTLSNNNLTLPCSQGIKTPYHAGLLTNHGTSIVKEQEPQVQDNSQQQLPPQKKMKAEQVPTHYQQAAHAPTVSQGAQMPGINPFRITGNTLAPGINPLGVTERSQASGVNPLGVRERTQGLGVHQLGVAERTYASGVNPLGVGERSQGSGVNPLGVGERMQAPGINPLGVAVRTHASGITGGLPRIGLSGKLGISMVGGQLSIPQTASAGIRPAVSQDAKLPFVSSSIPLPVGRGIRVGNIVPQTLSRIGGPLHQARAVAGAGAGNVALVNPAQNHYSPWTGLGGLSGGPGVMTEQAMAERRQRNREHAKRSRVRKKFMLESLQHEVRDLQKENSKLRMIIQGKLPQHAQKIIDECCQKSPLFDDSEDQLQPDDSKKKVQLVKSDFSLISSLTSGQQNFVLSDPRLLDNPIVYASEGFYQLTGYTRDEVLGRNCRFLQGPGTDPKAIDVIRAAVANGTDSTTCLLNYKADGTPFWNQFFVAALRDSDNCIVNYVGVQCAVESNVGATALEDKVNSVLPLQNRCDSPTQEGSK